MNTTSDWQIRGRTVLVTGGTGGIGYATARALVRADANVIVTGRDTRRGEDAAGEHDVTPTTPRPPT